MNNIKWIKLTVNMFDDEKIKLIQAMPEGDAILLIWVRLILLAGKTNEGGYVYVSDGIPYTEEMLSIIINKPIQIIRLALETFTQLGMIETDDKGIYLINFEKYQSVDRMLEIREYNKLAQRKHREKVKSQLLSMTSQRCQGTDIDIDKNKNRKEEIYKEEKFDTIQQFKSNLSPTDYELLNEVIDNYSLDQIKEAIEICKSKNAKTIKYLIQVLKNPIKKTKTIHPKWMDEDLTFKDVELTDEEKRELDEIIKGT